MVDSPFPKYNAVMIFHALEWKRDQASVKKEDNYFFLSSMINLISWHLIEITYLAWRWRNDGVRGGGGAVHGYKK